MSAQPVDVLALVRDVIDNARGIHETSQQTGETYADGLNATIEAVRALIARAENAEKIIRSVVDANQIGAGYLSHADDLRDAIAVCKGGAQ